MDEKNIRNPKEENAVTYKEFVKSLGGMEIKVNRLKPESSVRINPLEIPKK